MKRILIGALVAIILVPLAIVGVELASEPQRAHAAAPVADQAAQAVRGAYLARAGNCMACHTTRGGKEYAGGRAIETPFGNIYAPNLTQDQETGIGSWTPDDFWRAIHNGKSKDGSFLYPAFPYPNYTKVTRADSDALYAYFKTIPAVRQPNLEHELAFPYNQRILLAFWRTLYFTPGEFEQQPARSAEWNRGAYLVQGLGHCSACHTPRTALGGSIGEAVLGGGMIPAMDWYAPALGSGDETGLGEWEAADIASLLKTGVSARGAVFGPMAEVVSGSLQHLSGADVDAMAAYLKSLPTTGATVHAKPAAALAGDAEAVLRAGAKLYEQNCAACHGAGGKGAAPAYPPLAGNRSLALDTATNPVRMVLNGGFAPSTAGNPRPYGMPLFGSTLNDSEVAAVVSYIRTSWGNEGKLVSPLEVSRLRGAPVH
ncbi:c-type cytochrome [Massilia cavernae]|uniref:Cytochrome c n=1 Tax=Massilia cavernae TaxID=2320864 RepID=A0A418Y866_9BURK|nr:cytochrome c [Massilia cavernae]RJG27478.1 cytochrome c [Massilia cavernae]